MNIGPYLQWFDLGIVISIVAALFAALQWRSAQRSAESAAKSADAAEASAATARHALELGHRAWITVDEVNITQRTNEAYPTIIFTTVKNAGMTPAIDLTAFQECVMVERFPDNPTYKTTHQGSRAPMGPCSTAQLLAAVVYTPEQIVQMREDKLFLFLYGRATYNDVFGIGHETKWSYIFRPETHQFSAHAMHNMVT